MEFDVQVEHGSPRSTDQVVKLLLMEAGFLHPCLQPVQVGETRLK
jgi:hypothetical protein